MRARLGFALATAIRPEILILDEVLAVGDEIFRRKCYARMEQFFKSGCTILFVSHSLNYITEICTRAILVESGGILLNNDPSTVCKYYNKLILSRPGQKDQVLLEIADVQRSCFQTDQTQTPQPPPPVPKTLNPFPRADAQAYHLAGYETKTRVEYRNASVFILNPRILTTAGERVNHLVQGEEYTYQYEAKFEEQATNVLFGMQIKKSTGLIVQCATFPDHPTGTHPVSATSLGTIWSIRWTFVCLLNPGTYFLNAGVAGSSDGFSGILHRIEDAIAFRVLPHHLPVGGVVNLFSSITARPMETALEGYAWNNSEPFSR